MPVISRATSVYIIMLMIFSAGLWAILSFGAVLMRAPADLAGRWELYPPSTINAAAPPHQMTIDQSGRYFRVTLDGKAISLKQTLERTIPNPTGADRLEILLTGKDLTFAFSGAPDADEYQLQINGVDHLSGQWRALRTIRLYVNPDRPATRPAIQTTQSSR